jgi:hypothetical protein
VCVRSDRTGEHHIVYDDGDDEYIVLACERIEWLDPPPAAYSNHLVHGARASTPSTKVSPPAPPRTGKSMGQTNFQQVRTPSVRAFSPRVTRHRPGSAQQPCVSPCYSRIRW